MVKYSDKFFRGTHQFLAFDRIHFLSALYTEQIAKDRPARTRFKLAFNEA
jgi:hypothetical protein